MISKFKTLFKIIYHRLTVVCFFLFQGKKFAIKRGYIHRKQNTHFDDTANTDHWQKEVYENALELMQKHKLKTVIDVGCGSAYKLRKYFSVYERTGIEISSTFEYLKSHYPEENWLNFNGLQFENLSSDLVICSDVIEHVTNPEILMQNLQAIKNVKFYVISTPDRTLVNQNQWGPPLNKAHFREWSFREFGQYVSRFFKIVDHKITNRKQATQMVIVRAYDK